MMKKFIFTIAVLMMAAGCTPDNLPVEILNINLSPTSGFTTTCIAEIDAKGNGPIEVLWFNRCDSTGRRGITFENLYVDGKGTYRSILDCAPDSLEYYYQVIICDSAGTELAKSGEVLYYTDGPTEPPVFSFGASVTEGYAPLRVCFWLDPEYSWPDECSWDPEGTGNYIRFSDYNDENCWTYEKPGLYTVSIRGVNRWGTATVTEPDMIEVWE
jgi:PKD repeat protein